ncbi:MAG TPA: ACP S-malonyltransferase [Solirubrobacteraceae bacterium]
MLDRTQTAVLFPGQGSQTSGMRDRVQALRPDLLDAACELVGEDPFERVGESTRFAQPAIFCASLTAWGQIAGLVDPDALAGHSLGELSALAAAGALDELDALRLVVLRGRLMAESGEASGGGTMLALVGGNPGRGRSLATRYGVTLANDNAPDQVVLSGAPDRLKLCREEAKADGQRALMLDVAGAFHSPQMAAAVEPFRAALAEVNFSEPRVTVVSCATTKPFEDPASELADALVAPVRWRETMLALQARGIRTYVDVGPGKVLGKLVARNVQGAAVSGPETMLEAANVA